MSAPGSADWRGRGRLLIDQGRFLEAVETVHNTIIPSDGRAEAAQLLDAALAAISAGPADLSHRELRVLSTPGDADARVDLGCAYRRHGRLACAERQLRAALTLTSSAAAHIELATLYLETDRPTDAGDHARAAIATAKPGDGLILAMAWRVLADLAEMEGDVAAQRLCLARACANGAVFPQPAPESPFETLLLSVSGQGNTPTDALLPPQRFGRTVWFMDHASPKEIFNPPPHHVAFNAVGDADALQAAAQALGSFSTLACRTLLNPPDRVAATRRDLLPATLAHIPDIIVPQVFRVSAGATHDVVAALRAADPEGLGLWLHRPAGRHGGEGLERLSTEETLLRLAQPIKAPAYLTRYHHYRSPDGFYRKYRMIFVGREIFPYHLAIAPDWLVHHRSAGMETDPVRRAEEMAFLSDPRRVLGDRAYAAVASIGAALGLDYAGVDFSVTADGRVLVFEANAAMCVHVEPEDGVFAAKTAYVTPILEAFQRMLAKAAAADES